MRKTIIIDGKRMQFQELCCHPNLDLPDENSKDIFKDS